MPSKQVSNANNKIMIIHKPNYNPVIYKNKSI